MHLSRNSECCFICKVLNFPDEFDSFARESIYLRIARDAHGDDDPPDEILSRELALDKELVQLIQTACKNDKLPRALELTCMLHHISSFDMAAKVAAFYRLIGLQEKMEALKEDRIARGKPRPRDWRRDYDPVLPPRLPPADGPRSGSRLFQDFGPPAAVHRPGLARATPSLPPLPKDDVSSGCEDNMSTVAGPSESKRKRADEASTAHGDGALPENAKRRALEDDDGIALPQSKPSTCHSLLSLLSLNLFLQVQIRLRKSPATQLTGHAIHSHETIRIISLYTRARVSLTRPKLQKPASGKVCCVSQYTTLDCD